MLSLYFKGILQRTCQPFLDGESWYHNIIWYDIMMMRHLSEWYKWPLVLPNSLRHSSRIDWCSRASRFLPILIITVKLVNKIWWQDTIINNFYFSELLSVTISWIIVWYNFLNFCLVQFPELFCVTLFQCCCTISYVSTQFIPYW